MSILDGGEDKPYQMEVLTKSKHPMELKSFTLPKGNMITWTL